MFEILEFELKTSKNENSKFTIFQANQYREQNGNLSMYFTFVKDANELFVFFYSKLK